MTVKMYAISAHVTYVTPDGWHGSRHLPVFYLHPNPSAILNTTAAESIARRRLADVVEACTGASPKPGTAPVLHVTAYETDIDS
jgi:hypothetical protein